MTVFVGGAGELFQGDLDLGRRAAERLAVALSDDSDDSSGVGAGGIVVEELHYGAVAVAQRLAELRPSSFVLVGAIARGREPGTVLRRAVTPPVREPAEMQRAVEQAVTGYVDLDLILDVAAAFGALPEHTVCVEVEPASTEPSEHLSDVGERALTEAVALVRAELAATAGR
ncbi:MAG: hypothetical protein GEU97_11860 [Actinophytocola sp.]|nr:hypothetical protein [Actinophytocola sp.]